MARRKATPAHEEGATPEVTTPAHEEGATPEVTTPAHEEGATPEVTTPAHEEGLVAMTKGGEVLHVHHTCVQSHKNAGWMVLE